MSDVPAGIPGPDPARKRRRSAGPTAGRASNGSGDPPNPGVTGEPPKADPMATRITLLWRIRNLDDAASWVEFAQRYQSFIAARAIAHGTNPSHVPDAIQVVLCDVAKSIHGFEHNGEPRAFRKWLGNLAFWRTHDLLRAERRFFSVHLILPTDLADALLLEGSDLGEADEAAITAEVRRELLTKALRRVRDRMEAKTYRAFELVALKGRKPREAAHETGMTRSSVYVAKHRAIEQLKEEIARLQRELR